MRCDAATHDRVRVPMLTNLRMLFDKCAQELASCIASFVLALLQTERSFGCGFVATTARG